MVFLLLVIIIIIIINFFRRVFSLYTYANATTLVPLDTILHEILLLSLVLAVLCGLKGPCGLIS